MRCAFVGLGVMGYPMAGHLMKRGHEVCVFNRNPTRAARWVAEFGGRSAATPAAATEGAEVVLTCVGDDPDVREVVLAPTGVLSRMSAGSILIDHTTASADLAGELFAACASKGVGFLDAPVSGGQAGAERGQLTIMVGGEAETFARAEPIFACYGKFAKLLGGAGAGQLTKMVNQICIAGVVQGIAEGLNFAQKVGLDGVAVVETIAKGAAQSWQMENRHQTMLKNEFSFGFAVDWMRKDLGIALAEAKRQGVTLPLTALVDQFYGDVQKLGGGRWDTSSLIARLR